MVFARYEGGRLLRKTVSFKDARIKHSTERLFCHNAETRSNRLEDNAFKMKNEAVGLKLVSEYPEDYQSD